MSKDATKKTRSKTTVPTPDSVALSKTSTAQLEADINRFLSFKHNDPHQLLGPHVNEKNLTIRVFRPDAAKVEIVFGRSKPLLMNRVNESGVFDITVNDTPQPVSYKLKIHWPNNEVITIRDPYAFPPTIGELDLHLFGE